MSSELQTVNGEYRFDCGMRDCSQSWAGEDLASISKRVAWHYNVEHGSSLRNNYERIDTVERGGDRVHENIFQIERIPIYVTAFDVMERIGKEDGMAVISDSLDVCTNCMSVLDDTSTAVDTSESEFGDPKWRCQSCDRKLTIKAKQAENQQLDEFIADGGAKSTSNDNTTGATSQTIKQIESHLYAAMNDGEMNRLAHGHVAKAFKLLEKLSSGAVSESKSDSEGQRNSIDYLESSFLDTELYPDPDELEERVREHASERFDFPFDTSPKTWEIRHIWMENCVVHYRVGHELNIIGGVDDGC